MKNNSTKIKIMERLEQEQKNLENRFNFNNDTGLYVNILTKYIDNHYISNLFIIIADSHIKIYPGELFEIAYNLWLAGYVEQAIGEAWYSSMIDILQRADYLRHIDILYSNENNLYLSYIIEKLTELLEDDSFTNKELEIINNNIDYILSISEKIDVNNKLKDIDLMIYKKIEELLYN